MDAPKRKISVTLDADLLAELRQGGGSVSAQLNEALRNEVDRRRQQAGWQAILDEMLAADGPLDTPQDHAAAAELDGIWAELDRTAVADARPAVVPPESARRRAS